MSIITRAEVKNFMRLIDSYTKDESVTMSSVAFKRLANKPNVTMVRVGADTVNSTVSSTSYSTADYYTTVDEGEYTVIRRIDTGTIGDTSIIYVSYTYNDWDDDIDRLIPIVERDLTCYLGNYFVDQQTQYTSGNIEFLSTGPYITDSGLGFSSEGFLAGMDIVVDGTDRNEGIYTISAVSDSKITLTTNDTVLEQLTTQEYGGQQTRISRIKWPPGIKSIVSQIIYYNIYRSKNSDIQSKRLGPSSVTYTALGSGGYSDIIYRGLAKYKQAYTK